MHVAQKEILLWCDVSYQNISGTIHCTRGKFPKVQRDRSKKKMKESLETWKLFEKFDLSHGNKTSCDAAYHIVGRELFPRCNTLHETSDKKGGGLYHERGKVWKMQNVAEKQNFETQYIAETKNFEDVIDVSQGV